MYERNSNDRKPIQPDLPGKESYNAFLIMSKYVINHSNKPPTYICQDCGLNYTHFDDHMIMLKQEVWLSIANKEDVVCDTCIAKRLNREINVYDLWISEFGNTSMINEWYLKKLIMTQKQEDEATYFALCLLIPKQKLESEIEKLQPFDYCDDSKINKLCQIFGVTHAMIVKRMQSLNVL